MSDVATQTERLEHYLEKANSKLADLRRTATKAKGPVSRTFAERMTEAEQERDRLREQLKALRLHDALSWSSTDPRTGILQVCDEIGHRLDELFGHLDEYKH